jgi:hypothetical protein
MDLASLGKTANIPKAESKEEDISFSDEGTKFNLGLFICWVAAFVAIGSSIFIFLMNSSAKQKLDTEKNRLQEVLADINSSNFSGIENKAASFKSSVVELTKVNEARYKFSDFLPLFYKKINSNIKLTNIVLGSKDLLTIDGKTDSYKSVAEQAEILRSWNVTDGENILTNVQIVATSLSTDKNGNQAVSFTISCTVNKKSSLVAKLEPSAIQDSTSTIENENGGEDATIE